MYRFSRRARRIRVAPAARDRRQFETSWNEHMNIYQSVTIGIVVIAVTLSADRMTREMFGDGYLVALMAGLALNVTGWLTVRALINPTAAEGRIRYSAMYRYRSSGAQTLGLASFTGAVGILFGNLAFGVGSLFLLATAVGYFRRERQASRRAV